MNKLFTWLVGLANPLWSSLGADPQAIKLILTAKLIMDDRSGVVMGRQQAQKKGMEWLIYFVLIILGLGLGAMTYFMTDLPTAIGIVFSICIVYIGLLLVTEMSENLFDQRDLYVLLSRPINDVTLSMARILHISIFSAKFALCLAGPAVVAVGIKAGILGVLIYFFLSVMAIAITMTGTLVFYLLMLRSVPKHRLKQIVGYFQMVATAIFFFAYQLPNLLGDAFDGFRDIALVDDALGFLFPGLWLGGLFKVLTWSSPGNLALLQGALGLAAAVGGLWFYVRQSRGYISSLLALKEVGSSEGPIAKVSTGEAASPWRDRFAGWFTTPDLSRASFRFHWNVMVRDMGFKQRTYPGMVYLPIILLILTLRDSFSEEDFTLGESTVFLILYFVAWILVVPLAQTKISESYRASWIFMAAGNAYPGRLRYGQLMSVICMFFIPTALILYPLVLLIWGPQYWLDILMSMGNVLLATFIYHAMDTDLPFGRSKEDSHFSNLGPLIVVSIFASIAGFGHYFMSGFFGLKVGMTVLVWGGVWLWLRAMRK